MSQTKPVKVVIKGDDHGNNTSIRLNGEDISRLLSAVQINLRAGRSNTIVLTLRPGVQVLGDFSALPIIETETDPEDLPHYCGDCGSLLQIVRPGKWQCPECE